MGGHIILERDGDVWASVCGYYVESGVDDVGDVVDIQGLKRCEAVFGKVEDLVFGSGGTGLYS